MMWPQGSRTILVIIFAMVSTGCSKSSLRPTSEVDQAKRHISDGNYNSAIHLLNERLTEDPRDSRARVVLASAYAGRAGIYMREYHDIVRQIVDRLKWAEETLARGSFDIFDRLSQSTSSKDHRTFLEGFERAYKAIFYVNQIVQIFDILPNLEGQKREDLRMAIAVLSEEDSYVGGPALYRGLLRLVAFKNDLNDRYDLTYLNKCRIEVRKLTFHLSQLRTSMMDILNDFVAGSESGRSTHKQLLKAMDQVNQSFDQAITLLATVDGLGQIDNSVLTKNLNGKCEL